MRLYVCTKCLTLYLKPVECCNCRIATTYLVEENELNPKHGAHAPKEIPVR